MEQCQKRIRKTKPALLKIKHIKHPAIRPELGLKKE